MTTMTDLEMVRKCAEKMGIKPSAIYDGKFYFIPYLRGRQCGDKSVNAKRYNPLHDDAQAMALVVRLRLRILPQANGHWCADNGDPTPFVCGGYFLGQGDTPNRAIVECVSKLP